MSAFAFAVSVTCAWTKVYTLGLPHGLAEERRAEIASDLWEAAHDPEVGRGAVAALQVIARVLRGMGDDLAWRFEQMDRREHWIVRRAVALAAAAGLIVALWFVPLMMAGGRGEVRACADAAAAPQTTPDLRLEIVRCAGAFFTSVAAAAR